MHGFQVSGSAYPDGGAFAYIWYRRDYFGVQTDSQKMTIALNSVICRIMVGAAINEQVADASAKTMGSDPTEQLY
jgi:hypothetical protein